jgi:signal transduction histidine kinase
MVVGMLLTQIAANALWWMQWQSKAESDAESAAQFLARNAANTVRYFRSVPPTYRPLLIQQFREMGGTRFFVSLSPFAQDEEPIQEQPLARLALQVFERTLRDQLPFLGETRLAFVWPERLQVAAGVRLTDVPESWVAHILQVKPDPAPVVVLQAELEPGHWLLLATVMPNPYFLQSAHPLSLDRLVLQSLPIAVVLLLSAVLVLRWITRPLATLSEAAQALGRDEPSPPLPETGSREFVHTARAFRQMKERIQHYLEDRERLFISISHDLRTPITRLKLRTELLDDPHLRDEFEEDLDELDMMVKGALQSVKDTQIHENTVDVRLDPLITHLVDSARLAGHLVAFSASGLTARAKPLALKRALGNLLDNALHYGERAEIRVSCQGSQVLIDVRDHGPGVPPDALNSLFDPHVRLAHGRSRNESGLGLGLGIARNMVHGMGGDLQLQNHPQGGLLATVQLPAGS